MQSLNIDLYRYMISDIIVKNKFAMYLFLLANLLNKLWECCGCNNTDFS